jgi:LDH2 family malate/lactate/ureidoglycolate dehydrogenase
MKMRKNSEIPLGWALDNEGHMTTDPEQTHSLMPMGGSEVTSGFKGYGLRCVLYGLKKKYLFINQFQCND